MKNLIETPEIILLRVGVMGTTSEYHWFPTDYLIWLSTFYFTHCPINNIFLNLLSCCKMCECCCNSKESPINLHVTLTQYWFNWNISLMVFKKYLLLSSLTLTQNFTSNWGNKEMYVFPISTVSWDFNIFCTYPVHFLGDYWVIIMNQLDGEEGGRCPGD